MTAIVPFGLEKIGDGAFRGCSKLTGELIIDETLNAVGQYAFSGTGITELEIKSADTVLGGMAFTNTSGLKKVTIPIDLTYAGYGNSTYSTHGYFSGTGVEEIHYTRGNTGVMPDRGSPSVPSSYENACILTLEYGAQNSLKRVTYDEGITRIGDYAYYSNTALTDVLFAQSVNSIGTNCLHSLTKDNVKFYGYKDSYAETYADNLGVYFVPLSYPIITTETNEFLTGAGYTFEARTYSGIDQFTTNVSWSIEGQSSDRTTIDENGLLKIGADESAESVTVIADNVTNQSMFEAKIKQHTHEYSSEATFRWTEDYTACDVVVKCQTCNAEKSYACTVTKSSELPSCSKEGKITYTANVTISNKEYTDTKEISQNKTEHTVVNIEGNDPTCTEEGLTEGSYCSECGEVIIEQMSIAALGHDLVKVDAVEPTEELTGNIEYYICNRCGKYFSDSDGKDELPPTSVIIEPVNHVHELSYIEAVESTCTVKGHKDYYFCSKCGKMYSDQDGIEEIFDTQLPLAAHSLTKTERVEPTKTKDGCEEYYSCDVCGRIFKDADASEETSLEELIIPAYGEEHEHNWVETKRQEPTCTKSGWIIHTCQCGEQKEEMIDPIDHHIQVDKSIPPTCTRTGLTEGSHCSVCNTIIVPQKEIAAQDHTYTTITTKATTDIDGSIVKKCTVCGHIDSTATIYYPKAIILSRTSFVYSGKVQKPGITVVGSDGNTIPASNYTITYSSGCKNVGTYTIKIAFKGNYSGSVSKTYFIVPKGTSIKSLKAGSKKFTVKWTKQATQTTGYQIQYSTNSKFTKVKTVTITKNSTVSKAISKLAGRKKYYVRIRTYRTVTGRKYYSSWSKTKSVVTKK